MSPFHCREPQLPSDAGGRRSGVDVDAEDGRGDGAERVAVEGLGFVEINQVGCGHPEGFARVGAEEAAELLGEGGVLGPDNSEVRNQILETRT